MNFAQKSQLLKWLYEMKQCRSFVETGTYEARMTSYMVNEIKVPIVRSIELDEKLASEATALFRSQTHVKIIQGDSNVELAKTLAEDIVERPLIWLDAHWSAGKTTRSANGKDTPISEELIAVKSSDKACVVVIDDIRCFNGTNNYPTKQELSATIEKLWPEAVITWVDDVAWFEIT